MRKIISIVFMFTFMFNAYASQAVVGQLVDGAEGARSNRSQLSLALQYDNHRLLDQILRERKDDAMKELLEKERVCNPELYSEKKTLYCEGKPVIKLLKNYNQLSILTKIYLPMVFQFRVPTRSTTDYIRYLFSQKIVSINDVDCGAVNPLIRLINNMPRLAKDIITSTEDANLDGVDEKGYTVLHSAIHNMFTCIRDADTGVLLYYELITSPNPYCLLSLLIDRKVDLLAKNKAGETFFDMALSRLTQRPQGEKEAKQTYIGDDIIWRYSLYQSLVRSLMRVIEASDIDAQEKESLIKRFEAASQQLEGDLETILEIRRVNREQGKLNNNSFAAGVKSLVTLAQAAVAGPLTEQEEKNISSDESTKKKSVNTSSIETSNNETPKKVNKASYFKNRILKGFGSIAIIGLFYYLYNYSNYLTTHYTI